MGPLLSARRRSAFLSDDDDPSPTRIGAVSSPPLCFEPAYARADCEPSLNGLLNEDTRTMVALYCDAADALMLGATCKDWHRTTMDDELWVSLACRRFQRLCDLVALDAKAQRPFLTLYREHQALERQMKSPDLRPTYCHSEGAAESWPIFTFELKCRDDLFGDGVGEGSMMLASVSMHPQSSMYPPDLSMEPELRFEGPTLSRSLMDQWVELHERFLQRLHEQPAPSPDDETTSETWSESWSETWRSVHQAMGLHTITLDVFITHGMNTALLYRGRHCDYSVMDEQEACFHHAAPGFSDLNSIQVEDLTVHPDGSIRISLLHECDQMWRDTTTAIASSEFPERGCVAVIHSLRAEPQYNGRSCVIVGDQGERKQVKLADGKGMALRLTNLVAAPRVRSGSEADWKLCLTALCADGAQSS